VDSEIAQADEHLTSAAKASAALTLPALSDQQATNSGPYAIVRIPLRQPQVIPVSSLYPSRLTGQLTQLIESQLGRTSVAALRQQAQRAQNGVAATTGTCQFPCLNGPVYNASSKILAVSVWVGPAVGRNVNKGYILVVGQSASNDATQVRGFIIAELITGTALIALLALGGEWLIGRGLEPLDDMTKTADEITTRGDLSARMPETDDQTEVGKLGSSINTMLDRIQQAFGSRLHSEQKVREFAADASHELRTPLTTIRGYAELYRQGALGPDQLPNAMRRIEQEAERMSTLVAELLELARLDRTSSLDLAEADLAGVVRDAVADAVAV
jgi:signal transduction histidine kinase